MHLLKSSAVVKVVWLYEENLLGYFLYAELE